MLNFWSHEVKVRGGIVPGVTRGCFLLLEVCVATSDSWQHAARPVAVTCPEGLRPGLVIHGTEAPSRYPAPKMQGIRSREARLSYRTSSTSNTRLGGGFSTHQQAILRISGHQLGVLPLNSILTLTAWS